MSNRSIIIIYIIYTYMINLLPLRLIIIRTYERDSDNITPQLLLKYWHFKNNFIPSLILFKIEKIKKNKSVCVCLYVH